MQARSFFIRRITFVCASIHNSPKQTSPTHSMYKYTNEVCRFRIFILFHDSTSAVVAQRLFGPKSHLLDAKKTPLQCALDRIMMLTFFDAVVIAIATCSHRDSNMMLSSCVHVVINLANTIYHHTKE